MHLHFQYVCYQLKLKMQADKDRMPIERRSMLVQLPKFLDALKHEVVNEESPIWDPNFKPPGKSSVKRNCLSAFAHMKLIVMFGVQQLLYCYKGNVSARITTHFTDMVPVHPARNTITNHRPAKSTRKPIRIARMYRTKWFWRPSSA